MSLATDRAPSNECRSLAEGPTHTSRGPASEALDVDPLHRGGRFRGRLLVRLTDYLAEQSRPRRHIEYNIGK